MPDSGISLLDGWLPLTLQVIAAAILIGAIGWRTSRWRLRWLPVALVVGVVVALLASWYVDSEGMSSGRPAPLPLWLWIGAVGVAAVVAVVGWRDTPWWRRGLSIAAIPATALCAALVVNTWTGYTPTVQTAWTQVTGGKLPGQTDESSVSAMQEQGEKPPQGTLVEVTIPADASGFNHREEYVYLPPAWYSSNPPPVLPTLVLVGAEFGGASDWLRAGDAQKTADEFAATHGGVTPVLVFVDAGGQFRNDTGCVNGPRGNAADHITKDVVPYVISKYGVSPDPAHWGVVGWSMGGTCAVMLTAKYPELFSAFIDIDGDLYPNAGVRDQTIARLFGGDEALFTSFEPTSVMAEHGVYANTAGLFVVTGPEHTEYRAPSPTPGVGEVTTPAPDPRDHEASAAYLCEVASLHGMECSVFVEQTQHDWPSAAKTFADFLPWIAAKVGTPGVPPTPLPGAPGG